MSSHFLLKTKIAFSLIFLISLPFFLLPQPARAETISSVELVENPNKYDGKTIIFEGEVVGDVMIRGDYAWINVNDDPYSKKSIPEGGKPSGYNSGQSIWIKSILAKKILHTGSYHEKGDIIRVKGKFNKACPLHGGDMDIHAQEIKIVKRGYKIKHPLNKSKTIIALFLFLATTFTISGYILKIKRFKS